MLVHVFDGRTSLATTATVATVTTGSTSPASSPQERLRALPGVLMARSRPFMCMLCTTGCFRCLLVHCSALFTSALGASTVAIGRACLVCKMIVSRSLTAVSQLNSSRSGFIPKT